LKVSDIYTNNQLPTVGPETPLSEVIIEISSKRLGCTAVIDVEGMLLGIITDGDLRRMLQKNVGISGIRATDIMSTNPRMIEKDAYATKALHLMQENSITQLVVMDGGKLAGFIHLHDLLKEGIV
jgi:arabinose-5-phosphate isomerase